MRNKFTALLVSLAVSALSISLPTANAVASKLTLTVKQTPNLTDSLLTFYGTLTPKKSGLLVKIQSQISGKWADTRFSTKTSKLGTWKLEAVVTAQSAAITYRAKTTIGATAIYSPIKVIMVKPAAEVSELEPAIAVEALGPGGRIHGVTFHVGNIPTMRQLILGKCMLPAFALP